MEHRKRHTEPVAFTAVHISGLLNAAVYPRVMTAHHGLRKTGAAGGKQNDCRILGGHLIGHLLGPLQPCAIRRTAQVRQRICVCIRFFTNGNHMLMPQPFLNLPADCKQISIYLVIAADTQMGHIRQTHLIDQFFLCQTGVQHHRNGADFLQSIKCADHLGFNFSPDTHMVTLSDSPGCKGGSTAVDFRRKLPVCPISRLIPQGRAVMMQLGCAVQQLPDSYVFQR